MFSGLGSISDLNQQFAQFTSNLTNLDSLQDGSAPQQDSTKSANSNSDEQTPAVLRSLQLDNVKLAEELSCQQSLVSDLKAYLAVKDDQLHSKDSEVAYLTKELNEAIELEQTTTKAFAEYKMQTEEKLKALTDGSADRQSPKKSVDKSSPTKGLMVANRKIAELERQLAEALNARPAELSGGQSDAGDDSSHKLELEESRHAVRLAEEQVLELKNKLAAAEEDLFSKTGKYSEEIASAKQYIEQLRSECLTSSESAVAHVAALQDQLANRAGAVAKLEADVQAYLTNIVELNEEKSALLDRSAAAESRCAELEVSLRAAQASVSALQQQLQQQSTTISSNTTISDELAQLQELADTRAHQLQEAEGKVSTLTEKLKDMMHRFAELKAKSTAQAQQLEERIADITKLAQAKDSEILGLRLKMENAERFGSDTRLKVNELAERYGEAQREITRLRSAAEERLAEAAILTEQRDVGAAALVTCETQRADLAQRLQQLEEQAASQLALHETSLLELKSELTAQRGLAEEQMARLRAEVEAAQGRLRLEEDSAGNLDNYKKRAQLALKKANTANATLSAEVQQLQAALDEATARLAEAQGAAKAAMDELAASNEALQLLRTEKKTLELTLSETQALSSAKEQEYTSRLSELQDLVSTGRAALLQGKDNDGAAAAAGATRCTQIDGGNEEAAGSATGKRIPAGPVVAAVAAVLPASAAAVSAGVLSLSPSNPTDASPDGDSSLNGDSDNFSNSNGNNKSLGGSSWAMVAASESRLTSTHPSTASLAEEDGAGRSQQQHHHHHYYQDQHAAGAAVAGSSGANHGDEADEPSDFRATPLSSDSLLFINQLQNQLESVRKELSRRGIDLEAAHQQLQYEKDEKRVLKNRVEELLAYLERMKQLREGPDSAINMEYLKNCVFKFMSSSDLSEKRRLYPVIATILKLTSQEMRDIEVAFQATEDRENEFQNTISSIGSFAASSFGSLWGSAS